MFKSTKTKRIKEEEEFLFMQKYFSLKQKHKIILDNGAVILLELLFSLLA